MGDRGNIAVIQSENDQVWFYTHWSGSEIEDVARRAVAKGRARWGDESYFARAVADEFLPKMKEGEEPTGYGVSCRIQDNEYPIMVLDCNRQIAFTMPAAALENGRVPKDYKPKKKKTFQEFAQ